MRLQLAEPVTLTIAAAVSAGKAAASFFASPQGQAIIKSAAAIFKASPQAEQDRYNATLAEVRNAFGLNNGMTLEKAVKTLEGIPAQIAEAQRKSAAGNTGEKRVMARYIKAFEQVADETMNWVNKTYNSAGGGGTPIAPPALTPAPPTAAPAFPGSPGSSQAWYKNPVFLLGGAGILALLLLRRK